MVAGSMERATSVDVGGGLINYRLRGEGPLLALVSTLSGTWLRQVPELRKSFTVLTYDMRGFGDSPSKVGFPSNAEHANDLATLLDVLHVPEAIVVGLSHGGLVSQYFAARHAERLSGLVLVSTFAKARNSTQLFLQMLNGFLDRDDLPNFWEVLKSFLFSAANSETLLRRETALRQAMFDQYTTESLQSIYGQAVEHDGSTWLGAICCPTLVIGGEEDMLFPPEITRDLAKLVPNSRLVMLPAAHVPPVEVPQQFNKIVTEFSKDVR